MEQKKLALFLYGMPGSGKGTQKELLAKKFKDSYPYILGEKLREIRNDKDGDETLKEKLKIIDKGFLLPDETLFEFFHKTFKGLDKNILLLDGLIRSKKQAEYFIDFFKKKRYEIKILFITLTREESVKRILKRSETSKREDDKSEERINRRIDLYEENHALILQNVSKKYIFEINGIQSKEKVFEEILEKINLK